MKQTFAYTGPTPASGQLAQFVQVFEAEDGVSVVAVRDHDGRTVQVAMSTDSARAMDKAIDPTNAVTGSLFTPEECRLDNALVYLVPNPNLPPALKEIAKGFEKAARFILDTAPRNAQRTMALNSLVDAKDRAVRAALPPPAWL